MSSNLELPGLTPSAVGGVESEIMVELGSLPADRLNSAAASVEPYFADYWDTDETEPRLVVDRCGGPGCYHFTYDLGVEFVVDTVDGEIWGRWDDDLGPDDAILYLLGPILGFVLRQRGVTCLHAGAVAVDGRALVLCGPSGAGKSTLTAVLARQGFPVLTEDVLPLVRSPGGLQALPGYPRLRLRPDVVEHIYGRVEAQPRLTPHWERRYLDLSAEGLGFYGEAIPLGAIYLLDRDDLAPAPALITPLAGHEAVSLLAANTYRNDLLSRNERRDEFLFLADLVRRTRVMRVRMPSGLDDLERLGETITAVFRGIGRV